MNKPSPFTIKQHEYLRKTLTCWFNVAEGGKRGGKNVLQTIAFCIALDNHPNRLYLVAGVSTATARLNILDCDGYGLMNYFEGRCRLGKYQDRACIYVTDIRGNEKIVLVSGGGKNGDEKLIKGNTYGMAYVTEANECAVPFLREVFDRTVSSRNRKVFHDLNPKNEKHWYYADILEYHKEQQRVNPDYGYNYGHFTIADNMSVSDDTLKSVLATYDKNSVGRNILMGVIIFAIITTTVIALSINNTSKGIIDEYKERFGSEVFLTANIDKFMSAQNGAKTSMLTPYQYIEFAQSEHIKEFYMSVTQEIASNNLKAIDEKSVPDGVIVEGSGVEGGDSYVNPQMLLKGNTWDDFDKGMRKVIDGKMVENNNECLISKELADLNNLYVGDTLSFKGSTGTKENKLRTLNYEFVVAGIYFDATDEYSGSSRHSLFNRRNEVLTTTEGVINALEPGDYGLGINTRYFLKNPSMLSAYESELRVKGLNEFYDVKTDEAGYKKVVSPVEGLRSISITFMIIVLILGSIILILLSSIAIRERKYEIGLLRAMGMKKRKVAFGLWMESLIITLMCLCIGLGAGALVSQPVTNMLLAGQIENAKSANEAHPIGGQFYFSGMNSEETDSSLTPLEELDVSLGLDTIWEIIPIALILASIASTVSIIKITKYEPIKILMERN